jgi:beta-lactamase class A
MKSRLVPLIAGVVMIAAVAAAQASVPAVKPGEAKQQLLWSKLESAVRDADRDLDGVLAVAIEDLTTNQTLLWNADEIMPQASAIKITVLAELYHQSQQAAEGAAGKARLTDLYTVNSADLVPDSDIMGGLTPRVTRVTLRDLATMMVAVSDNSATNVLIDRVGMDNVNALLDSLGLKNTRLRRKMMDLKAAQQGRENISTPREMMALLEAIYHGKVLNPAMTTDFIKMLSTPKNSEIARDLPDGVQVADKTGSLEGVRTDSGIVFARNRPFIICVMTTYDRREKQAEAIISRIAVVAYGVFDRLGRASPYGRVISPGNSTPP